MATANQVARHQEANADSRPAVAPVVAMRAELACKITAYIEVEGDLATPIPGLTLYRRSILTS